MTKFHKKLTKKKWHSMDLIDQMSNVGMEVFRVIKWKNKDDENSKMAFFRALELLELTINDPKNSKGLKELVRTQEMLTDWYLGNPMYNSTDEQWNKYFMQFNIARSLRND